MATETMQITRPEARERATTGTVSFFSVIRSEWTKLWSLRSTKWTLATMLVVSVGFSALRCAIMTSAGGEMLELVRRDPTSFSLDGISLGLLAAMVLGVMSITTEFTTRSIRGSLIAVPRRLTLLAAKAIVLAPVVWVAGTLTAFASFFVGQAILSGAGISVGLGEPDVLRAVLGGGLFLLASAMFGLAVGTLLRGTASGIAIGVAGLVVVPQLTATLRGEWGERLHYYFTSNAGRQVLLVDQLDSPLGPWTGYLVFTLWWVVILAVAAVLMRRRDA
ncbi:MAG TPA: hypothetical protein VFI42_05825 [Thermomicrobiaceae bacterium]|nr:hypothetical protein [Thermomicrobiaceae bacterium]